MAVKQSLLLSLSLFSIYFHPKPFISFPIYNLSFLSFFLFIFLTVRRFSLHSFQYFISFNIQHLCGCLSFRLAKNEGMANVSKAVTKLLGAHFLKNNFNWIFLKSLGFVCILGNDLKMTIFNPPVTKFVLKI